MICPKCNFQNPVGTFICQKCRVALPDPESSVPPPLLNQPNPPARSSRAFIPVGAAVIVIMAVSAYLLTNNQFSSWLSNLIGRDASSLSGSTTIIPTNVQTEGASDFSKKNCIINKDVAKKFGDLFTKDSAGIPNKGTSFESVVYDHLPTDFPIQLSPHPAMELCWVNESRLIPNSKNDRMNKLNPRSYLMMFAANADLTELMDWYQVQLQNQSIKSSDITDITEESRRIYQLNIEKYKQAGINTIDFVKALRVTLPSLDGVSQLSAGIVFMRVDGTLQIQLSYVKFTL